MSNVVPENLDESKVLPIKPTVTIKGAPFEVGQIKVRNIKRLIDSCGPVYAILQQTKGKVDASLLASMVSDHMDNIVGIVSAAVDRDAAWVGDLELSELTELFLTVVEVNLDFFIKSLLPSLSARVIGITQSIVLSRTILPSASQG